MSPASNSVGRRIVIVGAGAAGLMAAIEASASGAEDVLLLDGAARPGAKILVSGGGRCNLSNRQVDTRDFSGSTPPAVRKILRGFDVSRTLEFFASVGVEVEEQEQGKLFPVDGKARSVLDALLDAAQAGGVQLRTACRVESIRKRSVGFELVGAWGRLRAGRVILATGGKALPKSGSDGSGFALVESLGLDLTPRIFPALVPLLLDPGHCLCNLSGIAVPVRLELRSANGKRQHMNKGALLCTHFGISGPAVLDISRHYLALKHDDPQALLVVDWLPERETTDVDRDLQNLDRGSVIGYLRGKLPARLSETLCGEAGLDPETPGDQLRKDARRRLLGKLKSFPLPICGDRGFAFSETTAGGVPLSELNPATMESRKCSGLHLCGEICDVDGRIGGFNFQWAWSSGFLAGRAAASFV